MKGARSREDDDSGVSLGAGAIVVLLWVDGGW